MCRKRILIQFIIALSGNSDGTITNILVLDLTRNIEFHDQTCVNNCIKKKEANNINNFNCQLKKKRKKKKKYIYCITKVERFPAKSHRKQARGTLA